MENKNLVRSDNHVTIDGWMINELELSGSELIVYGLIWGFSQTENQWCTASQAYIARWANISTRGLRKILDKLEEKGLLIKETTTCKKGLESKYRAIRPSAEDQESDRNFVPIRPEQSSYLDGNKVPIRPEQSSYLDGNKVPIRWEQSSYNNIEDNIDNNIADIKENIKRNSEPDEFEELWKLYPRKEGKKDAYKAYKKAIKEGTTNEQIRQGIENYKAWLKAKNETTYIKQGSTFFNGEHWNDEFDLTQINRGDPFDVRNQYWDETDPTVH